VTIVVPPRFQTIVDQHLVFNFVDIAAWPLILGVFGRPGDGKSFQIRAQLKARGVIPIGINAADLESDRAGTPGKMILDLYEDAGHRIEEGEPAALVVDDFDTTVGEWAHSTTTVNHQQVLAQLMHLADSPSAAANKTLRRVPVILTGNDLGKVYPPLRRPGRMRTFAWLPTEEERIEVVAGILRDVLDPADVPILVSRLPEAPIAFFSDLRVELVAAMSDLEVEKHASDLKRLTNSAAARGAFAQAVTSAARLPVSELSELAIQVWHDRTIATQSYVGS
jgi:hypothetical protein